jgi:hypothetical protein
MHYRKPIHYPHPAALEKTMKSPAFTKLIIPLAIALIAFAGCSDDDDPANPAPVLRSEVALDLPEGDSQVAAIDFTGNYGMAMARTVPANTFKAVVLHDFLRQQPDGSWLKDDQVTLRDDMVGMDLTLDTTGKPVVAGHQIPGPPSVVADFRMPETTYIEQGSYGMLAVDGEGSFMVASGRSRGGGIWTSEAAGAWNFDVLPLTGTNDSGFRDVYIRGDRAVACGYDDGGDTLQVILTRTSSTDWEKIPAGGPFNATYYCIALTDDGTIFVGGIAGAGGMNPEAFISQRTSDGLWADLILPDPEQLHGVMDILIADDGDIYLACMGEGDQTQANLVHAGAGGVSKEITPFPGGLLQLGQSTDGDIYAVGFRRNDGDRSEQGVILVKTP